MANIKHWSTALGVVSKLSSAVVKQLLVNVVHYIYTAIKEKPHTSTKELTQSIVTPLLVILSCTWQQVYHLSKFTVDQSIWAMLCSDILLQEQTSTFNTKVKLILICIFSFSCFYVNHMYTSLFQTMKLASVPRADPYEAMEILLWCRYMY